MTARQAKIQIVKAQWRLAMRISSNYNGARDLAGLLWYISQEQTSPKVFRTVRSLANIGEYDLGHFGSHSNGSRQTACPACAREFPGKEPK
jgi:hypothetical protein